MINRKIVHFLLILFCLVCAGQIRNSVFAQTGALSRAFKKVNPSVVKILTVKRADVSNRPKIKGSLGSGVVISKDGLVLTSAHEVDLADKIMVVFLDNHRTTAKIVASSDQADVSLLKLDSIPKDFEVAELGDSDAVQIGDQIFVIGAPYGIDHTLTVGHISGRRQSRTVCHQLTPFEFLQTDAAINKGNSGGPMFDERGKIVGIVSRILSNSGGSMGIGFAVSINTAKKLLLEQKSFWIGFNAYLLSGELAKAFNVPQEAGLLVQHVAKESPGDILGLKAGSIPTQIGKDRFLIGGDIVLTIQGFPVTNTVGDVCAIQDVIGGFTTETQIELTVLRKGKIITLTNKK